MYIWQAASIVIIIAHIPIRFLFDGVWMRRMPLAQFSFSRHRSNIICSCAIFSCGICTLHIAPVRNSNNKTVLRHAQMTLSPNCQFCIFCDFCHSWAVAYLSASSLTSVRHIHNRRELTIRKFVGIFIQN